MSAVMSRPLADDTSTERSVDELDGEIGRLVRQMSSECYRMLVLVREFDDRFGWKKWRGRFDCGSHSGRRAHRPDGPQRRDWVCGSADRNSQKTSSITMSATARGDEPSAEGFRTTPVQRHEVREPATVYRVA